MIYKVKEHRVRLLRRPTRGSENQGREHGLDPISNQDYSHALAKEKEIVETVSAQECSRRKRETGRTQQQNPQGQYAQTLEMERITQVLKKVQLFSRYCT